METRATSRDVARLAGVAQATVSNVLNGKGPVAAETRTKVLAAAKELNYQPNLAARSMRTQRTGRIALVLGIASVDPAQMINGAAATAHAAGYTLEAISIAGDLNTRSQEVVAIAQSGQFEGVLSLVSVRPDISQLVGTKVPIVVSETYGANMRSVGDLADASPIVELMDRLIELGHRRFLHIAGLPSYVSATERIDRYESVIKRHRLTSLGVVGYGWTGDVGEKAISALSPSSPPLAVIAANDILALGAIRAAALRGWSVPGDMSITGWDNYEFGQYLLPTLTTVKVDRAEGARREMNRLLALLGGAAVETPLPPLTSVIWRESTGAPA